METKHEQILHYIEKLKIGHKISVRQIAKELQVSDGTAYRAIKEAETQGLVQTMERVGTVRIEKAKRSNLERLTYAEVVKIIDGHVLGGKNGLHKTLQRFVIGAMELEAMMRYVEPDALLIVGNREEAHQMALEQGAAVLITGGFDTTEEIKRLADEENLPIISSTYDTFSVAALINRALDDRLIKKEILLVEDVWEAEESPSYLRIGDTLADFFQLVKKTGHSRYPVVDKNKRVVGILTSKDAMDGRLEERVERVMTREPITVLPTHSLASAAHEMVWEGIELLPIVNEQRRLLGVISRQDVIKALQRSQKSPTVAETLQEASMRGFQERTDKKNQLYFEGRVSPQMIDSLGNWSTGALTSLLTEAALQLLRRELHGECSVQNFTLYVLKPVQMESLVQVYPRMMDMGRKQAKVEIEVIKGQVLAIKALLTAHIIEH